MTTVISGHNAGFFSCCFVKLYDIVTFFNINKSLPDKVDSSQQFSWYKNGNPKDLTYEYFEDYNKYPDIKYSSEIVYHWQLQFSDYSKYLPYEQLTPFMNKYFSPSSEVKEMVAMLEEKYRIDYSNTCVLFYRGLDKNRETTICDYEEYIPFAKKIQELNPDTRFLIQSDETEFITNMLEMFPDNSFYMNDEIRHIKKSDTTVDYECKDNILHFSKLYLAITIIMSKCKNVICGSGNCSMAIVLYRGNSNGVYQNFNGVWLVSP